MPPRTRQRGHVRKRGNSHQVFVYAGLDPVTGKEIYLSESTTDEKKVAEIQTRLLAQVDRQRNASTKATLGYVIETYLDEHDGDETTLDTYRGYYRRSIKPQIGDLPTSQITARALEQFYGRLRKCSVICRGADIVDHRTTRPHECREVRHRRKPGRPSAKAIAEHDCGQAGCIVVECKPHACKPMGRSSVRQIHAIISGALDLAVRWGWIDVNPATVAKKPKQAKPRPKPPTSDQAAALVEGAFAEDYAWGMLVWLTMITGPRRGELLARRFTDVDFNELVTDPEQRQGTLILEDNYIVRSGKKMFKDTKDHQQRRIALDAYTLAGLAQLWDEYTARCAQLDVKPKKSAHIFSYAADNSQPCNPDGITHRFGRLCKRLDIDCHLHALRHFSATELITAGVDVRTVAGRLGHGGGGTTTLRVYASWVPETDKRAATILANRMPRPGKREAD